MHSAKVEQRPSDDDDSYSPPTLDILIQSSPVAILRAYLSTGKRPARSVQYEYWHVESLLNRAADIAQRCINVKKQIDEYWVRATILALEIRTDSNQSTNEDIERGERAVVNNLYKNRETYYSIETPATALPGVDFQTFATKTRKEILENKLWWSFKTTEQLNHGPGASAAMSINTTSLELLQFNQEVKENSDRALGSSAALTKKTDADAVARLIRADRKRLASNGDALDYLSKARALAMYQLGPDLCDVLDRCIAAREGLEKIYGWQPSEAILELPSLEEAIEGDGVLKVSAWINGAIRWLLQFSQREQPFTKVISLTEKQRDFLLASDSFPGIDFVRVRGVSAVIVARDQEDSTFSISLYPPPTTRYLHDAVLGPELVENRGAAFLGRVAGALHPRPPEICGGTILFNASPVGIEKWRIEINPISVGAKVDRIEEIRLEFSFIGRPRASS